MLCECGQREATIHEVVIKNGKKIEKHLCEQCARKHGLGGKGSPLGGSISELITKAVISAPGGTISTSAVAPGPGAVRSCPTCKLTLDAFKSTGLLGCADCYDAFSEQLDPILERAHEGATHHVGKIPRRALAATRSGAKGPMLEKLLGGARERAQRLASLRRQLDEAVEGEQYERAARLRDEIRMLGETVSGDAGINGGHGGER